MHALLNYLEAQQFSGSPRAIGIDGQGREVLTFLPGETVGDAQPWPAWVHSDAALLDVGAWLRRYHDTVAGFVPPADAAWRLASQQWKPGMIVGHNDAAPYNAVWRAVSTQGGGRLSGFIDWDFAGPCSAIWDLAYVVFSWGPLHARDTVTAEGFSRFEDRPRRVRLLLDAYGYTGTMTAILAAVRARVEDLSDTVLRLAREGDPLFRRMVTDGTVDAQRRALAELDRDAATFEAAG
ncbi:phosphotransferase [Conexibacter sp. DBS9H8]|uniref:phosphotransferase n=1 Tax=Conexibacter sp. DBS9H8 TaxID=2937801 RepID=UPI0020102D7F|nr:phosphotransferase [Conexibacter sp. DBS9H8]